MVNLLITGLGKLTDGSSDKFHKYDGISGYLIIGIRILMYLYFLYNIMV